MIDMTTLDSTGLGDHSPREMTEPSTQSISADQLNRAKPDQKAQVESTQECHNASTPNFLSQETNCDLRQDEASIVQPYMCCNIEAGFFLPDDSFWTIYRRNYFRIRCSYRLDNLDNTKPLFLLKSSDKPGSDRHERIQGLAMCVRAVVDGSFPEQSVELLQQTPRRDKLPQTSIPITRLSPAVSSQKRVDGFDKEQQLDSSALSPPCHKLSPTSFPPKASPVQPMSGFLSDLPREDIVPPSSHTFERLQFKTATANNGKRRVMQEKYKLIVELYADVRTASEQNAMWLPVARRCSVPLVVRGRSPGHYTESIGMTLGVPSTSTRSAASSHNYLENNSAALTVPKFPQRAVHRRFVERVPEDKVPESCAKSTRQSPSSHSPVHFSPEDHSSRQKIQETVILDDSSVSSLAPESDDPADTAWSSVTSHEEHNIVEQFVQVLLERKIITALLRNCISLVGPHWVERNIRRLLDLLAFQLRSGAKDEAQIVVSQALRRYAREISISLRLQCAPETSRDATLNLERTESSEPFTLARFLNDKGPDVLNEIIQPAMMATPGTGLNDTSETSETTLDGHTSSNVTDSDNGVSYADLETQFEVLSAHFDTRARYFRDSEAIEEFQEGVLDLCIAAENSYRNLCHNYVAPALEEGVNLTPDLPQPTLKTTWLKSFEAIWKVLRPRIKPGTRRIEWQCDCGKPMYADFSNEDPASLDDLAAALQSPKHLAQENTQQNSLPEEPQQNKVSNGLVHLQQNIRQDCDNDTSPTGTPTTGKHSAPRLPNAHDVLRPSYLALCVRVTGIYKRLAEIDVSNIKADEALFLAVKDAYQQQKIGIGKIALKLFLRPTSVEFVQFNVWDVRSGYVSICDGPKCVPPKEDFQYDFAPRPLTPLPPVPPEVFLHYLEHSLEDGGLSRYIWTPRIPKRLDSRVIDCRLPTPAWGIYIKEGPDRKIIFWIIMANVFVSILVSVLWSAVRGDVQGGSGLGAFILALPSVIMAAFLFRIAESLQ